MSGRIERTPGRVIGVILAAVGFSGALVGLIVDLPHLPFVRPLVEVRTPEPSSTGLARATTAAISPEAETTRPTPATSVGAPVELPSARRDGILPPTVSSSLTGLNVIVFDGTGDPDLFRSMADMLERVLPDGSIIKNFDWTNKRPRAQTGILWQGDLNRSAAECLNEWLGGHQPIDKYIPHGRTRVGRVFGIAQERDLIVFIGLDYQKIIDAYRVSDAPSCG